MQGRFFLTLCLSIVLTEGFIFSSKPKCQIKKYNPGKHIVGEPLLIHENFQDRAKALDEVAKQCKVNVFVKGSYYQLKNPADQVLIADADRVIGHGFAFELRDESNAMLCNQLCLSRNPTDISEVKCFIQGATSRGLVWSRSNSNVISDGTYAANPSGYQTLKTDIQTRCKDEKLKRQLLRALRRLYDEEENDADQNDEDEKKK